MEGYLKVTPEKLIEASERFAVAEADIRSLTNEMTAIVDGFKTIWQGEAAGSFVSRFTALSDDMERIHRMINEHANDLNEMARQYQAAENESEQEAAALTVEAVS